MAMLRSIPGMSVLAPGDANEVRACLRAALKHGGPVYMRIGKKGEPVVHENVPDFTIGRSVVINEGKDVTLLAVGVMLPIAIETAKLLEQHNLSTRVVSVISVKPQDEALLENVFSGSQLVATIEEHSLIGGYGSSVGEWLIDSEMHGAPLLRFGTADTFIHESGETHYARNKMGLEPKMIAAKILDRVKKSGLQEKVKSTA